MITKQELKNQYFNLRMTRRKYTAGIYGSILNKSLTRKLIAKLSWMKTKLCNS